MGSGISNQGLIRRGRIVAAVAPGGRAEVVERGLLGGRVEAGRVLAELTAAAVILLGHSGERVDCPERLVPAAGNHALGAPGRAAGRVSRLARDGSQSRAEDLEGSRDSSQGRGRVAASRGSRAGSGGIRPGGNDCYDPTHRDKAAMNGAQCGHSAGPGRLVTGSADTECGLEASEGA